MTDGTNANVGAEHRAIRYLEMMLGKPLHYLICQLHGNELKRIVSLIIVCSAPMLFIIKCNPGVTKGPVSTFRSLQ